VKVQTNKEIAGFLRNLFK